MKMRAARLHQMALIPKNTEEEEEKEKGRKGWDSSQDAVGNKYKSEHAFHTKAFWQYMVQW